MHQAVRQRRPESRLIEFAPDTGADAHCQVNNLPLALAHTFAWLNDIGLAAAGDVDRFVAESPHTRP
ncbi:MAG: hypothetical protein WAZ15_05710 [Propioniciclava sp.]